MIRVDVETILMAAGPVPSVIVLRERTRGEGSDAPTRSLSIQTGAFEAAAVGRGIDHDTEPRPITHDLMIDAIDKLGGKLERVEIDRVDAPVFYASLVLQGATPAEGDASLAGAGDSEGMEATRLTSPVRSEIRLDARPSDALALAVRVNAPIFVEDDVMNRVGTVSYRPASAEGGDDELARFDAFVEGLSPDDF